MITLPKIAASMVFSIAALFSVTVFYPASAGATDVTVEVAYAPYVAGLIPALDTIERQRETSFRKYRDDLGFNRLQTRRRLAKSLIDHVKWANESLIKDAASYGVTPLIKAMVRENLEKSGLGDKGGTVHVQIDRLRVANHSIARISGHSSYITGSMRYTDASGRDVATGEFSANLVVDYTVDYSYNGPDYAFADTDISRRVGPTVAYFIKKGMGKLFPGNKFAGPILVTF